MTQVDDRMSSGLDRLNGLVRWWGLPKAVGTADFETQFNRLRELIAKLNRAFDDALRVQRETLSAANERFTSSLPELMRARDPGALLAVQLEVARALAESIEAQNKVWAKLIWSLHDDCRAMAWALLEGSERSTDTSRRERRRPEVPSQVAGPAGTRVAHA